MKTCIAGWVARNGLERYRPMAQVSQVMLGICATLFYWDAILGAGHGFRRETWGALAYSIPARWWGAYGIIAALVTFIGLCIPIRRWLIVAGAAMQCAQFFVLSWSAAFTGGEPAIGIYAYVIFLPAHIWLMIEGARYGRDAG